MASGEYLLAKKDNCTDSCKLDELKKRLSVKKIFLTLAEITECQKFISNNKLSNYIELIYDKEVLLNRNISDIYNMFYSFTFYYNSNMYKNKNSDTYPYGVAQLADKITLINETSELVKQLGPFDAITNSFPKMFLNLRKHTYVEVMRFEKVNGKFVLDDPEDARLGTYHKVFWALKGQYYYPCRGSGLYLQVNKILTGFNKLHILEQLNFSIINSIYDTPGLSAQLMKYVKNFASLDAYKQEYTGNSLLRYYTDSKLSGKERAQLLQKYCLIYDANWNQLVLDTTMYLLAKQQNYDQILLTHEPTDKAGVFGVELIDLEDVPLLSTNKLKRFSEFDQADKTGIISFLTKTHLKS